MRFNLFSASNARESPPMPRRFEAVVGLLERCHDRPLATAAGVAAAVVISLFFIANLELVTSYAAMLPDDAPEVRDATVGAQELESTQELTVAASGDLEQRQAFAKASAGPLEDLPGIVAVDLEWPTDFFEENWLLLLDPQTQQEVITEIVDELQWERRRRNPLYADLGVDDDVPPLRERLEEHLPDVGDAWETTADGEYLLLSLQPRIDVDTPIEVFQEIVTDVDEALAALAPDFDVEYRLSGHMVLATEEYESLRGDLGRATGLAFVLVLLLLTAATRRPAIIIGCGVPLVVGLVFTLAATELFLGRLNMVSAFMLPALLGLGVDFGIHLHNAYDVRLRSAPPKVAIKGAVREIFPACLAAACTTAAGFSALLLCDFDGISEYGFIAGVGILFMLLATFLIAPIITPRIWTTAGRPRRGRESFSKRPFFFAFVGIGFLLFALIGLPSTSFENDFRHLRGDLPTASFHQYLMDDAGRPFDPTLLIVDTGEEAKKVAEIARQERFTSSMKSTDIGTVIALSDFLPTSSSDSEAMGDLRRMLDRFGDDEPDLVELRRAAAAAEWEAADLPDQIRRRLVTNSDRGVIALYSRRELGSDVEFARWQEHLQLIADEATDHDVDVTVVDKWAVVHRMLTLIRDAFWPMVGLAVALVLLTTALLLGNRRRCLFVVMSITVGTAAMAGALGWMNLPLNLFSIVVLPSIFGIGVDNAIQLMAGFSEDDFSHVMVTRWQACLISTATTAVGFGALIIADHQGVASLGQTALIGLFAVFVATSVVLPALMAITTGAGSDS